MKQGTKQCSQNKVRVLVIWQELDFLIARFPGCVGEDGDAKSAFFQITLKDAAEILGKDHVPETFISLPRSRWPQDWIDRVASGELVDPVRPLRTNLYGHPLAGLSWDKFLQKMIRECGSEKVLGWESLYVHKKLQVFLGVYVDDFHLSGKSTGMEATWTALKKHIDFGDITDFNGTTYLGCTQKEVKNPEEVKNERSEMFSSFLILNTCTTAQDYEMKALKLPPTKRGGKQFKKTSKGKGKGKTKAKPDNWYADLTNDKKTDFGEQDFAMALKETSSEVKGWYYEMEGAAKGCVERYCELAGLDVSSLKKVGTPCVDDHTLAPEELVEKGVLSPVCSQAVLKCWYMIRLARPELYWDVNSLAREVTKWTVACDKRLHRLISFIHHHKASVIKSWVGNKASECKLVFL